MKNILKLACCRYTASREILYFKMECSGNTVNVLTINHLMSVRDAVQIFHIFDGSLIG